MSKMRKFKIYDVEINEEVVIEVEESEIKTKRACEMKNVHYNECRYVDCYALANEHSYFFEEMIEELGLEVFLEENELEDNYEVLYYVEDEENKEDSIVKKIKIYMLENEEHRKATYVHYKGCDLIVQSDIEDLEVEEAY